MLKGCNIDRYPLGKNLQPVPAHFFLIGKRDKAMADYSCENFDSFQLGLI
jgi:hypothetical protein